MTPAREAAEFLDLLFPDTPARIEKRKWPAMGDTRVPSTHKHRRDPRLLYMLGIAAVAVFAAIVIGVATMRRATEKQIVRGHQRRATSRVAEPQTEAYLQPMQHAARQLGVQGVSEAKGHASNKKPKEQ
ncbi:hypothetical protein MTO96_037806, partial [Rhipicephalus appendiculatus]